jgi:EpsD family peptidyl-prolyl cis-trans isomerase
MKELDAVFARKLHCALLAGLLWTSNGLGAEGSEVVARVGGDAITVYELMELLPALPLLSPGGEVEAGRQRMLDSLVRQHLFAQEAVRLGLDRDARVKARLEMMRSNTLGQEYLRHVAEQIAIGDDAVAAYYEGHREQFPGQELAQVREPIRALLKEQAVREAMDRAAAELKSRQKIVVDEEVLKSVQLPAQPPSR